MSYDAIDFMICLFSVSTMYGCMNRSIHIFENTGSGKTNKIHELAHITHWSRSEVPKCPIETRLTCNYWMSRSATHHDPSLQQCGFSCLWHFLAPAAGQDLQVPRAGNSCQQLSTVGNSWWCEHTYARTYARILSNTCRKTLTANKKSNHWEILGFPIW